MRHSVLLPTQLCACGLYRAAIQHMTRHSLLTAGVQPCYQLLVYNRCADIADEPLCWSCIYTAAAGLIAPPDGMLPRGSSHSREQLLVKHPQAGHMVYMLCAYKKPCPVVFNKDGFLGPCRAGPFVAAPNRSTPTLLALPGDRSSASRAP
jgi:hypothetical protein